MGSYTSAKVFRVIFFVFLCLGIVFQTQATHIKAGDIKAERISTGTLTYRFTLNLYTRLASETGIPSDQATLNFGDGKSATVNKSQTISFDGTTENNVFVFYHTYGGGSGSFFRVGYQEVNRIASIINMSNSVGTPFYIELGLQIGGTSGLNRSPILTVPPIDKGVIGQIYTHNPGAYDPDGDSLVYTLVEPQSAKKVPVGNYKFPDQFGGTSTSGGTPFITINPISGDIVWNAPSDWTNSGSLPRYYNIAIRIDEFRGNSRIGYIIRDMQIEIVDSPNKPPVLRMPSDTCIVAGAILKDTITASHPQPNHNITLQPPYTGLIPTSTFTFVNDGTPSPIAYFNWQPTCADIREQPYDVVVKASDNNANINPKLTDVRSFLIYVKAPKPQNLAVTPLGNSIKLTWDSYKTGTCSNVDKIKIYRKECSAANVNPEPCDDGIPLGVGYVLIKTIDGKDSVFTDTNNGAGLTPGVGYCYAIIATFPSPGYGISYPSDEACGNIAIEVPMEAVVSVTNTSLTTGTIQLNWFEPLDNVTGPFTYDVYRASSDAPATFAPIATAVADTFYTDASVGLNTLQKQYFYKIKLSNATNFSPVQTSVLLTADPRNASALLTWKVTAAFNLDTIEVWRSINGSAFSNVKTLVNPVKSGNYTDAPIANCDNVKYFLRIKGHYCDPKLPGELISDSPIQDVIPMDDNPPPAPVLTLKSCADPYNLNVNDLTWTDVRPPVCNTIKGYNLYYAPHSGQSLSLLASVLTDTNYVHVKVDSSLAGCYEVKAVNYQDIESAASNRICIDNCVYYQLPNLVTRDNNGRNDIFQAFPIPLGVRIVNFKVYNRWGNQVYSFEGDPNLNWRTVDGAQNFLSEGVYYYEAEVHYYRRLNPDDETEILKGWVHLLGDKEAPKK